MLTKGESENYQAHRFAYEQLVGPIPSGLTLDHLCRVKRCVNPTHLEPTSIGENTLRGIGPSAQNARKAQCRRGHPLSGENLVLEGRHRVRRCRTCRNENARRRYAETAGAGRRVTWPAVYLEKGVPVSVLVRGSGPGPFNCLIQRADGSRVVRPFRGLRRPVNAL